MQQNVTLIFDIGKTNKKLFLFNEKLEALYSEYVKFDEIKDDEGDVCEDLDALEKWIKDSFEKIANNKQYKIISVNFSAYGATLIHLNKEGRPCTPMYNYIKELPADTAQLFNNRYGDWETWSKQTASPFLGMLNAGLQLFWLKTKKPGLFKNIHQSVFLPQYLSFLFSKKLFTEYTGIGCHTGIWDFEENDYHSWMYAEGFDKLLPPIANAGDKVMLENGVKCGIGIHDSSSALLSYLFRIDEPFILLSTGTWSICLNPFNNKPLTTEELNEDCLCYLRPDGSQVKASRFFIGNELNKWVKLLDNFFDMPEDYHREILFNSSLYERAREFGSPLFIKKQQKSTFYFDKQPLTDLTWFDNYEEAYHRLIKELLDIQVVKIKLIEGSVPIKKIFVDGGFAGNHVFTNMLSEMMPDYIVTPSDEPLGTALGAAMMIVEQNDELIASLFNKQTTSQYLK